MENARLVRLLRALPPAEVEEFHAYVHADFVTQNSAARHCVAHLTTLLSSVAPLPQKLPFFLLLKPEEGTEMANLPQKTAVQKAAKYVDRIFSEVLKLLQEFLVWKQSKKESSEREILLFRACLDRRADDAFFHRYRKWERTLEANVFDANNHWDHFQLIQLAFEHPMTIRLINKAPDLAGAVKHLDAHFLVNKLINCWILLVQSSMMGTDLDIDGLEETLALARKSRYRDDYYIRVFGLAVSDVVNEGVSAESFLQLRAWVKEGEEGMDEETAYGMYNFLANYAAFMRWDGVERAPELLYELWMDRYRSGQLMKRGSISIGNFYNVVFYACVIGQDFEFAAGFMEEYAEYLEPQVRESALCTSEARMLVEQAAYQEAVRLLVGRPASVANFEKVVQKILLIRCYYELGENELFEYALDSARKLAVRSKELGHRFSQNLQDYVNLSRQLYMDRLRGKRSDRLVKALAEVKGLTEYRWLVEKAAELG